MKAVGYRTPSPINSTDALADINLPVPEATGHDLLVEIRAISVNPVDTKVRRSAGPIEGEWRVLGWDAAGVVRAVGDKVSRFKAGDEVWYAGSLPRPGSNAEFNLVDERIVSKKPASLDWAQAAAMPLTALTAWEALFDRLKVTRPIPGIKSTILIIGGAGGVGSVAIQIARQFTDLTVVATASRPVTKDFVRALGAHHVIDHSKPIAAEFATLGLSAPAFIFSTTQTDRHLADIVELIAPQGRFCLIDDPANFNVMPFKRKSVSIHFELMFTRSVFQTADMDRQGWILHEMARAVDEGKIRSTANSHFGTINAANLIRAHAQLESGSTIGKIVLEGFA